MEKESGDTIPTSQKTAIASIPYPFENGLNKKEKSSNRQ